MADRLGWSGPGAALGTTAVGLVMAAAVYLAGTAALRLEELGTLWSLVPRPGHR